MQIELDSDDLNLGALPRFERAAFHARRLFTLVTSIGGA